MIIMKLIQVALVKNKQKYKFCAETFLIAIIFSLTLIGIHYAITRIFKFSNQDSLILLIPVFLVSFSAIVYGYHLGFQRYSKISNKSHIPHNGNKKIVLSELFNICIKISLIIIPTSIGLYLVIIKEIYAFGVVSSLLGAGISIPISKKLYESLIQKNKN